MIIVNPSQATGRPRTQLTSPGSFAVRVALALVMGMAVAMPAGATDLRMPSVKSRLLSDRDNVTVIIIDKHDRRRSRSTSPARVDPDSVPTPPSSRVRRDEDRIYIKRKTGSSRNTVTNPGPKVIIVDKNRGNGCSGSGVCVIRP